MSHDLEELARLATVDFDETRSVNDALSVVKHHLGASRVSLVYGAEGEFRWFADESTFQLSRTALWFVNRDLASRNGPSAFQCEQGRVLGFRPPKTDTGCEYLAAMLPVPNSTAQMLVAFGPWLEGVPADAVEFLTAAGPALALLLVRRLDLSTALIERERLSGLVNITRVMSSAQDLEQVLSDIAAVAATVAKVAYVTIDLVDREGLVRLRCVNYIGRDQSRPDRWKEAMAERDPLRELAMEQRRPLLLPDIQNDTRLTPSARQSFQRSLIRSAALLPLLTRDDVIGVMSFAAHRPLDFSDADVDVLESLAAQVATAVAGVELYQELAASREALEEKSRQLERALGHERERARHDALTGALNHAAVTERLSELIGRDGGEVAVAMVDVDGMKAVNDTFGHLAGDAVLVTVAQALSRDARALVGRYGGDEFLVILADTNRVDAETYKTGVMAELSRPMLRDEHSGSEIPVAVSVGLTCYPEEAGTVADLIKLSDSAMYADKWQRAIARSGGVNFGRDERAAKIVGSLVPLLTSPGELTEKLALVAKRLCVEGGYDAVDCQLFDSPLGPPIVQSNASASSDLDGARERWFEEQRSPRRQRRIREILARIKRPIILNDIERDLRLSDGERQLLGAAGLQSGIVSPMLWQDELIGILSVAKREMAAFEASDAQFLADVAGQVTAIVRMGTLIERLRTTSDRLANAQGETVVMLAAAAEAHDRTTGMHLQSVRSLTEAIATELGYGESEVAELGVASILHDIGKISVPDTILASPMRLDTDDREAAKI